MNVFGTDDMVSDRCIWYVHGDKDRRLFVSEVYSCLCCHPCWCRCAYEHVESKDPVEERSHYKQNICTLVSSRGYVHVDEATQKL